MLSKILDLEQLLLAHPELHVELQVFHHFAPGVYLRELRIPKGTVLTGKIHKTEHLNVISQGRLLVWTEDGVKELSAPFVLPSLPGAKRVGFALEDTTWICVHKNEDDSRDLVELESRFVCETFAQFEEYCRKELSWLG